MAAKKSYRGARFVAVGFVDAASGSGSLSAPVACQALIYALAPGGAGGGFGSTQGQGGGGGAASFKRLHLAPNQVLGWACGAAGTLGVDATDTTVSLNGTPLIVAGGGKSGTTAPAPLPGGIATGGDINRNGGSGGFGNGTAATPGVGAGLGGGTGGAAGGNNWGGGGGGAGFGDVMPTLAGGAGGAGNTGANGANYGGGAGGESATGIGGSGRVFIMLLRAL
jgi:hypothetical protein